MKLENQFPERFYINLGVREDRRRDCLLEFEKHHLSVERMPAVYGRYVKSSRGMGDRNRYACGLKRLCLREARRRGADAVLIFEDDVVFDPQLRQRLAALTLPEDWGIFYIGCLHTKPPTAIAPGLVRVTRANDNHAFAIRGCYVPEVLRKLRPRGRHAPVASVNNSDVVLSELHDKIPTYAAWPNLAWQRHCHSNNVGYQISNYCTTSGRQLLRTANTEHLAEAMEVLKATRRKKRN
jgi:hypothetical protein